MGGLKTRADVDGLVLSDAEQALVDAVTAGAVLDLAHGALADRQATEEEMRSWGSERTISATVIRDILRGRLADHPDPRGVRLCGARISEPLDLAFVSSKVPIELHSCLLSEGMVVCGATLPRVTLERCLLEHPSQPPLIADQLTTDVLTLDRSTVRAHAKGGVSLEGAHLGQFKADGVTLANDGGPAVYADGLIVDQDVSFADGASVTGEGDSGAFHVIGARIGGQLNFSDAALTGNTGPALVADDLHVDLDLFLSGTFNASGGGESGTVRLAGAHIGGGLDCTNATLTSKTGPALYADGLDVTGGVFLSGTFNATGDGESGTVRLAGAHIGGGLDCTNATLTSNTGPALVADNLHVELDAFLSGTFNASGDGESGTVRLFGARIGGQLNCTNATLTSKTGPALYADNLDASGGVFLTGTFNATGDGESGTVRLAGAHIGGGLDCTNATLTSNTGPALVADNLHVELDAFLSGTFNASGDGESGTVRLFGARIGGQLNCTNATLTSKTGPALYADNLDASGGVFLTGTFNATGGGNLGTVRLFGARTGDLDCTNATLTSTSGPALHAESLDASGGVFLTGTFNATGGGNLGTVRLFGARTGDLDCTDATLTSTSGPALHAESLDVGRNISLTGTFNATGGGHLGTVRVRVARIGGQLNCTNATLTSTSGPALHADGLNVTGGVFLTGTFNATGDGESGTVRLWGARIGGQLDCTNATLTSTSGPALHAESLDVDHDIILSGTFNATGGGPKGVVRLAGAHIGGQLNCRDATLASGSGPALHAQSLQVDQDVLLDGSFNATGGGQTPALYLMGMKVGGKLALDPGHVTHTAGRRLRLDVDGLTYRGLPEQVTPERWLAMIQEDTEAYAAQPYQYLAAAFHAAGDDQRARDTLIAQRRDQLKRHALTGTKERAWARFTGVVLGYGYRSSRALYFLLGVVIISVILCLVLGAHGGLAKPNPVAGKPAIACTSLEKVAVGLDLAKPLVSANTQCDTTSSDTGNALTVIRWTLQVLAWALATLFIAGFTSAVRKN